MKENLEFLSYFSTPVYLTQIPEWIDVLNKHCDPFIVKAKKINKNFYNNLNKKDKKKFGDFGLSHHSTSLVNLPEFKEFSDYIIARSLEVLDHIGYDLKDYNLQLNNLWVQEFAEKGGGHHEGHVHYNNHLSGFYFLKCSNKTSFPIFHDPRPAKIITQLPLKNANEISLGSEVIHTKPKPGTFVIFPAFLKHQFALDFGIEPFRFIHFNVQAVLKNNL